LDETLTKILGKNVRKPLRRNAASQNGRKMSENFCGEMSLHKMSEKMSENFCGEMSLHKMSEKCPKNCPKTFAAKCRFTKCAPERVGAREEAGGVLGAVDLGAVVAGSPVFEKLVLGPMLYNF
jgi:hypothetical protein